jgi:hypothetical protein
MEMSGQSHASYALLLGKELKVPQSLGVHINRCVSFEEKVNILYLPVFEPHIVQPVAYLNFLSYILKCTYQGMSIQKYNLAYLCSCENWYVIYEKGHLKDASGQIVGESICT